MKRALISCSMLVLSPVLAFAQTGISDLLEGALVNPKVSQWAWYDLSDVKSGSKFLVRQAIVGSEKVKKETGYWVEFELVPELGFRNIIKMLLTGPASDPKNVHHVLWKEGPDPAEVVPLSSVVQERETESRVKRQSHGIEDVVTPNGVVRAEHTTIIRGEQVFDLWSSSDVPPTGIVMMRSAQGEMKLRSFGIGGKDGESVISATGLISPDESNGEPNRPKEAKPKVKVHVSQDKEKPVDERGGETSGRKKSTKDN